MTSGAILIYGGTKEDREQKVYELVEKVDTRLTQISTPDRLNVEKPKGKNSIGIAKVREVTSFLATRPYQASAKIVIIQDAHLLTPQAQNALLKTLEEPPIYAVIILSAKNESSFLPTVLSRCRKFKATGKIFSVATESAEYNLEKISSLGIGERLDLAQEIAKLEQEELLQILEDIVRSLRKKMLNNLSAETIETIKTTMQVAEDIENTNVNTRLALEKIFIRL